ncbi:MAG: sugar phosphate isomerase/epimerase [Puniceicoccaceae bacterium]|nr:MAG: sugar phosphate isomerase/epimerase [Puniceicoccaceae bacterium]
MKLGFVSAILPELPLDEVLNFAAENDFDCVELMCWPKGKAERRYAGVTHIDVDGLNKAGATFIGRQLATTGVEISGLGYYPNPLAPDKGEAKVARNHLKKVIDAAALLEVPVVNSFIGRDWTRSVEDNWSAFLKAWKPLVAHAGKRGVKIGIENCPMYFTKDEWPGGKNLATTPAIWRRMFEVLSDEHFGLNYDPSHLVWQQMDYLQPIREFGPRFHHVHAKDARVDRHRLDEVGVMAHPLEYHLPKLPGLGDVDWGTFFSALSDTGYHGAVCIEVEDRAYEGSLESRKAALRQSARYLRQFMP